MNDFYVYAYLREDGTPYYIGKGRNKRAYMPHNGIGLPNKERIKILHSDLDEDLAYAIEKALIKEYGRLDNNTGILRNRTDGGEGVRNLTNKQWINNGTEEQRIEPNSIIPDGWAKGRLWTLGDYHFINNGTEHKAILKTSKIPNGWVKGRLGTINKDQRYITDGKTDKFIDKDKPIPDGWKLGRAWRANEEQLKRLSDANKEWIWITDGQNTKNIHISQRIPDGWKRGRTIGILVKYDAELIESIIKDRNAGTPIIQLYRKYNIQRNRIKSILENPDLYVNKAVNNQCNKV